MASGLRGDHMFSFSFQWLWAQCFAAALGMLLLGHMASPEASSQPLVSGTVKSIETRYVKGAGNFYNLSVQEDDGSDSSVMIARQVASPQAANSLIGRHIRSHVNWSSRALDLTPQGSIAFDPDKVRQTSLKAGIRYRAIALFMAVCGAIAGLVLLSRGKFS